MFIWREAWEPLGIHDALIECLHVCFTFVTIPKFLSYTRLERHIASHEIDGQHHPINNMDCERRGRYIYRLVLLLNVYPMSSGIQKREGGGRTRWHGWVKRDWRAFEILCLIRFWSFQLHWPRDEGTKWSRHHSITQLSSPLPYQPNKQKNKKIQWTSRRTIKFRHTFVPAGNFTLNSNSPYALSWIWYTGPRSGVSRFVKTTSLPSEIEMSISVFTIPGTSISFVMRLLTSSSHTSALSMSIEMWWKKKVKLWDGDGKVAMVEKWPTWVFEVHILG